MFKQAFRRIVGAIGSLTGVKAQHQAPAPKTFEIPEPSFTHKQLPRIKRRKAPESWHRFCRQRAQWGRDMRDAFNAANGPHPSNRERMKMAQAKGRRIKAGLAA